MLFQTFLKAHNSSKKTLFFSVLDLYKFGLLGVRENHSLVIN